MDEETKIRLQAIELKLDEAIIKAQQKLIDILYMEYDSAYY